MQRETELEVMKVRPGSDVRLPKPREKQDHKCRSGNHQGRRD